MKPLYHIEVRIPIRSATFPHHRTVEVRTYTEFGITAARRCERARCREFPTAMVTVERQGANVRQPVCP